MLEFDKISQSAKLCCAGLLRTSRNSEHSLIDPPLPWSLGERFEFWEVRRLIPIFQGFEITMRMSLGNLFAPTSLTQRFSFASCRAILQRMALTALMSLPGVAWAGPHDFPFTEFAEVRTPDHWEMTREGQMISLLDIRRWTDGTGFSAQPAAAYHLLDLSGSPYEALDPESDSLRQPSFLADRPRMEEVVVEPQLAASELAVLTYRELCRHPFFMPEMQKLAQPENVAAEDLIAQCVPTSDTMVATENPGFSPESTGEYPTQPPTVHEKIEPVSLPPLFVIWNLEGREFLVPSPQAASWNYVPNFEAPQNSWCNQSCSGRTLASQADTGPVASIQSTGRGAVELNRSWEQVGTIVANGLDNAAKKLMQIAAQIRQKQGDREPVEQTATNGTDEQLK
jgi:hypothetical protein